MRDRVMSRPDARHPPHAAAADQDDAPVGGAPRARRPRRVRHRGGGRGQGRAGHRRGRLRLRHPPTRVPGRGHAPALASGAPGRASPAGVAALYGADALDSLLPGADFVILTVPHTPATEGFMNRARFQRMKRTAFFINIGRGMTTRLDDLVAALKAGEIAGAGLDVFEQEPLPAEHPLWTMPGVLITPHTAGFGPYLDDRRYEILRDNCQRFLAGQPLRNVVDKHSWF